MTTAPETPGAEKTLRAWWAAATIGVAAFAAYISLVPFDFVPLPAGTTVAEFIRSQVEVRVFSPSNLLANCVMFMPFGFFGAGTFVTERSSTWRSVAALVLLLPASIALSFTIEAAQAFVPRRTPSVVDVFGQTVGTMLGFCGWVVLGKEVRGWAIGFARGGRRALETGLVLYASVRTILLLQPMDVSVEVSTLARKFRSGGIILNPLNSPALRWDVLPSILADVVLAVPIGIAAAIAGTPLGTRRSMPMAIALGSAFFLAGEVAQLFIQSRTADVIDLLANCAGVAAGVLLVASVATRPVGARDERPVGHVVLTVALAAAALVYAAYNWSPFDFTLSRSVVAGRLGRLADVPFAGYIQNPEFKALGDVFLKMSLALPLGLFFHLRFRPDRSRFRRTITVGWLAATALFFSVVEIGQVLLPSRYPDNTDVLLATAGVWLGLMIARPFGKPSAAGLLPVAPLAGGAPGGADTRPVEAAAAPAARKPMIRRVVLTPTSPSRRRDGEEPP